MKKESSQERRTRGTEEIEEMGKRRGEETKRRRNEETKRRGDEEMKKRRNEEMKQTPKRRLEEPRRKPRVFEVHYDDSAWIKEIPAKLLETFPGLLPRKVVTWWAQRTQGVARTEVKWIPFHILYLDFQMPFWCPGPLRLGKQRVESCMRPFLEPEKHSHVIRLRWFRQFSSNVLEDFGHRCSNGYVSMWHWDIGCLCSLCFGAVGSWLSSANRRLVGSNLEGLIVLLKHVSYAVYHCLE